MKYSRATASATFKDNGYRGFRESNQSQVIEVVPVIFLETLYDAFPCTLLGQKKIGFMKTSILAGISIIFCRYWLSNSFIQSGLSRNIRHVHYSHSPVLGDALFGEIGEDIVWHSMRKDAQLEASREPLLASFMHATILSHSSLERALAFHIANLLSSPAMISTQIQALILEFIDQCPDFKLSLRKDILAVMDRDPAVRTSPDVILYFKGFQALQTHRVAHWLWSSGRSTLALFVQSRANTVFSIDIHPGAKLGSGIFIDHGTGVVIGETAVVGDNVSMLHKVTLGGTGVTRGTVRHPNIGNGVLLGAGATLLGNIKVGDGAHIGACSMVLDDVPAFSVAVGVPAKIISRRSSVRSLVDSPAITMETNQLFFFDI